MSDLPSPSPSRRSPQPFRIRLRRVGSDAVLDIHGEVDNSAGQALQDCFAEATAQKPARILLNFRDVDYINSMGIALIVALLTQARTVEVPLVAFGLSEHYEEIFRITRLSDFITLVDDEQAALARTTGA